MGFARWLYCQSCRSPAEPSAVRCFSSAGRVGRLARVPGRVLVLPDDSFLRALVVLPEFVAAVGSFVEFAVAELEALPESFDALFDFLLLADPVLPSPAAGVSPVGGVALAEGSAAALFFGLLVAVGVVFAFSPSVFPALSLLVLDLLREEVPEAPELLVVLSVPAASFESVFFLVLVFFEVVEVSPDISFRRFRRIRGVRGWLFLLLLLWPSSRFATGPSIVWIDVRPWRATR